MDGNDAVSAMRKQVGKYILESDDLKPFALGDLPPSALGGNDRAKKEDYEKIMINGSYYGGQTELRAFALMTGIPVTVHYKGQPMLEETYRAEEAQKFDMSKHRLGNSKPHFNMYFVNALRRRHLAAHPEDYPLQRYNHYDVNDYEGYELALNMSKELEAENKGEYSSESDE